LENYKSLISVPTNEKPASVLFCCTIWPQKKQYFLIHCCT